MPTIPKKFSGRITVTIGEAASMLGIKVKTLYNQVSAGICPIPTVRIGGRRFIKVSDLLKVIESDHLLQTPKPSHLKKNRG